MRIPSQVRWNTHAHPLSSDGQCQCVKYQLLHLPCRMCTILGACRLDTARLSAPRPQAYRYRPIWSSTTNHLKVTVPCFSGIALQVTSVQEVLLTRALLTYQQIVCEQHRLIENHLGRFSVRPGDEVPNGFLRAGACCVLCDALHSCLVYSPCTIHKPILVTQPTRDACAVALVSNFSCGSQAACSTCPEYRSPVRLRCSFCNVQCRVQTHAGLSQPGGAKKRTTRPATRRQTL